MLKIEVVLSQRGIQSSPCDYQPDHCCFLSSFPVEHDLPCALFLTLS